MTEIILTYNCPYCGTVFEMVTNQEMKNIMTKCYACGNFIKKTKFSKVKER